MGLPGVHAASVQVTDADGDRTPEVLLLDAKGSLYVLDGRSGAIEHHIPLSSPTGAERWEHLVVANFRGTGDRDLLLQTTNSEGYRLGRYLAAYSLEDLLEGATPQPLWQRDDFFGTAHSGVRVADLNGDGKDEVLGGTLLDPEGELLVQLPMPARRQRPHLDSIFVADVRPEIPGLEVVALEEGGAYRIWEHASGIAHLLLKVANRLSGGKLWAENRVFLYNHDGLLWETHYDRQEPQNAAIGDFDPSQPGLEIWCRSRYNTKQKPFVFNARGELIATYEMERVAPADWTEKGVEVIFTVDWTAIAPS
ncbi:hypothetical protein HC928_12260 [bacterium]|nr:hypothetical protein [bacterium]